MKHPITHFDHIDRTKLSLSASLCPCCSGVLKASGAAQALDTLKALSELSFEQPIESLSVRPTILNLNHNDHDTVRLQPQPNNCFNRYHCIVMQPSTPIRPVSGTFFEAVQTLRPHPHVRPVSAPMPDTHPRHTITPDTDRYSVPSGSTVVDRTESPHLYTSRRQYEVATGRTLGSLARLDTNVPRSPYSPGSMSPTSKPLSPRSMMARAKELLTPHSPRTSKTPDAPRAEKLHRAFCRTKSIVESLSWGSKEEVFENDSQDSLRSGFFSRDEVLEDSTISDEPPQIAPLRPLSKFLPDLTIFVPENDIAREFEIENNSAEDDDEIFSDFSEISYHDSPVIAPLHPRSSTVNPVSLGGGTTAETTFYTASETSFYYTPAAKEDDDVFTRSRETSHTQRPMTSFMAKLQDAMDSDCGYKTPSIVSSEEGSIPYTPLPSPKLRHSPRGKHLVSLRVQYSKAERASPILTEGVPKMWRLNEKESMRGLRVAPSLENGLHADNLEVFEENATAETAAIVHIEPDVVNVRRSEALAHLKSRKLDVSDQHEPDSELIPAPLVIQPRRVRVQSDMGTGYDVSTTPIEILRTIVFSAAYGDAKCTELASGLYDALAESDSSDVDCEWRKERLLRQAHLVEELKILVQYGIMRDKVFGVIRGQIFPTGTTEVMTNDNFTIYIRTAVSGHTLAEDRAEEILGLAIEDEDREFKQTSPEDEVFFQREPFDEENFVYDVGSPDECFERLGSLPSTVATYEHWDQLPPSPKPEPRWTWWQSPFMSKMARLFRIGYQKPMA
ncbi:hypothetical protein E8E11_006720 [Didymella keratinophila]|nr:hypothetical protein E8E11_006720 [Didymella keratinophila]